MRRFQYPLLILLLLVSSHSFAQSADSLSTGFQDLPANYYSKVEKKYASIDNNLSKKSIKYLKKLQRQEEKLSKKVGLLDSTANAFNADITAKYTGFIHSLSEKSKSLQDVKPDQYNSYIDTLSTSLSFLKKFTGASGKAASPLAALDQLSYRVSRNLAGQ